ncbi:MAG TPA: hypothetical protein VGR61_03390 [Candidatus Dormibacteraeota bacterium]|nr:hypothetical protein [Candidatus Dormibacteraeota bacterium]
MRTIGSLVAIGAALLAGAFAIGVTVALVSSPSSFFARLGDVTHPGGSAASAPAASPSPDVSPLPALDRPGRLGPNPTLVSLRGGGLFAAGGSVEMLSRDGGRTWQTVALPPGASSMLYDSGTLSHAIAGGQGVSVSTNAGSTWTPITTLPPGSGSYLPLLIGPGDPPTWFFVRGGSLLRTRDAGASWRVITTPRPLGSAQMIAGSSADHFFLASDTQVLELDQQAAQLKDIGALPGGAKVLGLALAAVNPESLLARGGDGKAYLHAADGWHPSGSGLGGPVAATTAGAILVGDGGAKLGSTGVVESSLDGGKTWSAGTGLPANESVDALATDSDQGHLYAYCFGGDVFSSADAGKTWTLVSSALRAP